MEVFKVLVWYVVACYVMFRLPRWFDASPVFRCLSNWWEYHRWIPCTHGETVLLGGNSDCIRLVCRACSTVLLMDTVEHWEAELAQQQAQAARRQRVNE